MLRRQLVILLPIAAIVAISFGVAWGLFTLLESTATVRGSWFEVTGGLGGFVVVGWLLYSWYERQAKRHAEGLAIEIARLSAASIVREGKNNRIALNTVYNDTRDRLGDYFSGQDKRWLALLIEELKTQTRRQVRDKYPKLREWEPKEESLDTVVEDL